MLDIKTLINNEVAIKKSLATRNQNYNLVIDEIIKNYQLRLNLLIQTENLQAEKNRLGKEVALKKRHQKNFDLSKIELTMEDSGNKLKELKTQLFAVEDLIEKLMLTIPNVPRGTVPIGKSESDNVVLSTFGKKPHFDFSVKPHWDLLVNANMVDFEIATKITGSRFILLKNEGAKLARFLTNLFLDHNCQNKFDEVKVSSIVNSQSLKCTGQLPKFADDLFKITNEYYLSPTSEVQLTNLYQNKLFQFSDLPKRNTAHTSCFRKEAGAAGKDTRGLIRLHEFNKVETTSICREDQAQTEFNAMIDNVKSLLTKLRLPFRIVTLCTADMGFSSALTYDFEVWFPSQNCYREVASCSICDSFQARRANIKYIDEKKIKHYCYTLNCSALPVERIIAALMENHQQKANTVDLNFLKNI